MITKRYLLERLCELETAVNILEDEISFWKLTYKAKKTSKKTTKKAK